LIALALVAALGAYLGIFLGIAVIRRLSDS
jgi:hypothetical protein